jgi:hypothetical protein
MRFKENCCKINNHGNVCHEKNHDLSDMYSKDTKVIRFA